MHFAIDRAQQLRKNYKNRRKQRGHEEFEVGHIFHDFNAIQATLAVVMRAIINGRIDSKTAGRLLWELQIASKLLRCSSGQQPLPRVDIAVEVLKSQAFKMLAYP